MVESLSYALQVTDAIAVGVLERPGVDLIDDPVFPPNDLSLPIGLPLLTKSLSRSECSLPSIDMTFEPITGPFCRGTVTDWGAPISCRRCKPAQMARDAPAVLSPRQRSRLVRVANRGSTRCQ